MLRYLTIPVTPFQQNCSLVWCDDTRQAAVIDPGGDLEVILSAVDEHGLKLQQIWLTHAHIDHAGATAELAARLKLPIIGPILVKAAIARSTCSAVCAADIWVRIRACPFGTTGNEKPIT